MAIIQSIDIPPTGSDLMGHTLGATCACSPNRTSRPTGAGSYWIETFAHYER